MAGMRLVCHFIKFNLTVGRDGGISSAGHDVFCSRPSEAPKGNVRRLSIASIADTRIDNSYLNSTLITSTHPVIYVFHLRTPMNITLLTSSVLLIDLKHQFLCSLREAYERALLQCCFELQLACVSPVEVSEGKEHMRRKGRDGYGLGISIAAESYAGGITMSVSLPDLLIPLLKCMLLLPAHLCSLLQGSVPSSVDVYESFRYSIACSAPSAASSFVLLLRASEKITLFSHTTTRRDNFKSCENGDPRDEKGVHENTALVPEMVEVPGRYVLKTCIYEKGSEKWARSNFSSREDCGCFEVTWEETEGMREKLALQWWFATIVLIIIKIASKVPRLIPERHAVRSYRIYKGSSQIANWVQPGDPRYPNFPRVNIE